MFGALERRAAAGEILAMGRAFGAASNFLTFSVDDVHTPGVLRMSFRSCSNLHFPAHCPDSLLKAMEFGTNFTYNHNDNGKCIAGKECLGSGEIQIPCNWSFLAEQATKNPVSVALHYKKLVHDIMTILVGINPASSGGGTKRNLTTSFHGWGSGGLGLIVGTAIAFTGVTETTGKGSLHFHVGELCHNILHPLDLPLLSLPCPSYNFQILYDHDSDLGWTLSRTSSKYINIPRAMSGSGKGTQ